MNGTKEPADFAPQILDLRCNAAFSFTGRPDHQYVREPEGYMRRTAPDGGTVICWGWMDASRPLSHEELDINRCPWCADLVGHTLEEHRNQVELTMAQDRAEELAPDLPVLDTPMSLLPWAIQCAIDDPPRVNGCNAEQLGALMDHVHAERAFRANGGLTDFGVRFLQ